MTEVPEKVREAYRELPPGWKLEKLKFFADVRNSNVDKTISEDEEPVRLCNYTDVYYNDRITPDLHFMEGSATQAEIERFQLRRNQVIITKDSEGWNDIGIPALVTEDMPEVLCGYHLSVFEPGPEMDGGFMAWLCRAEPLNNQFKLAANGVTRFGLGQYPMKNAFIALPPLGTQRQIARFLDEKTARIDGLIDKKRALLDRLAEKRQALITRAVTKGLDPHAPMKRSGIDWIGDIPAHWETMRLRFLLNGGTLNGLYKTKEEFDPEGIPFVQMGEAFRSPVFNGGTEDCVNASKNEIEKWGLLGGDFLIARRSIVFEGSGKSVLVSDLEGAHIFESSMIRIRPQDPENHSKYLSFYFQSQIGRESILSVTKRVTISGIDSQQLKSIHVPIPPNSDARDIAATCESYDRNVQDIEKELSASIKRLAEYRSALIGGAVTGQLAELR